MIFVIQWIFISKIYVGQSNRFQCFGYLHPSLYGICSNSDGLLWNNLTEIKTDCEDRRY